MNTPLDIYDEMPRPMRNYLQYNGWHFNKKAYEYAVSMMRDRQGAKMNPMRKDEVDSILNSHAVDVKRKDNYDYAYVAMMCKADFYGSSIEDDNHMARYIKDTCDDPDAADGTTMRRWYATMTANGISVPWEEFTE